MSNWNLNMSQKLEKPIFMELATGELARVLQISHCYERPKKKKKESKKKKKAKEFLMKNKWTWQTTANHNSRYDLWLEKLIIKYIIRIIWKTIKCI